MNKVVNGMVGRMMKTANSTVKMLVKSIGQTPVQLVLGMVIVVYIAFLESDKESVLSILMSNPMGRLLILGFLSLLAIAAPPVAVLFAVLIVMSYSRSDTEMVLRQEKGNHQEGFWVDDASDSKDTDKEDAGDDDTKDSDKSKNSSMKSSEHADLLNQLTSAMKTLSPAAASKSSDEGFGPMYEGAYNPDDDNFTTEEDANEFMKSMNTLGGIVGYSRDGDATHSAP